MGLPLHYFGSHDGKGLVGRVRVLTKVVAKHSFKCVLLMHMPFGIFALLCLCRSAPVPYAYVCTLLCCMMFVMIAHCVAMFWNYSCT